MRMHAKTLWILVAWTLSACSGGEVGPPGPIDAQKSTVTVDRATGARADGQDAVWVSVSLRDANDRPISGTEVRIAATGEGNKLEAPAATDAEGTTRVPLRTTVAGTKEISVSAGDPLEPVALAQTVSVTFRSGFASRLVFLTSPSDGSAGEPLTPAVEVQLLDAQGNPVVDADVPVTLALEGGPSGVELKGGVLASSAQGKATFADLRIDVPGTGYRLRATSGSLTEAESSEFELGVGPPAQLEFITQPQDTAAGASFGAQVRVLDVAGNAVDPVSVSLSLADGPTGIVLVGTTRVETVDGVAAFSGLHLEVAGTYRLAASISGRDPISSDTFQITAGPAHGSTSLLTVSPAELAADGVAAAELRVSVRDQYGNVVTGGPVTFAATGSNNVFEPDATVEVGMDGMATASLRSTRAELKTVTVQFAGSATAGAQVSFTPGPASATLSEVTANPLLVTYTGSGTAHVTVTVRDGFGNPIPGRTVQLSATGTGNTLGQPIVPTDAMGQVIGTLTSNEDGLKTVSAVVDPGPGEVAILSTVQIEFEAFVIRTVEDFETGGWPKAPWVVKASGGSVSAGCARFGSLGLQDPDWHYRTDVSVGQPGQKLSMWARPGLSGRAYLGFGSSSTGTYSLVMGSNTNELIFQENASYGNSELQSIPQTYTAQWYRLEVEFGAGGQVTGRLFGSDGTTLINSLTRTFPVPPTGGIAIRSFSGVCLDEIEIQ